MHHRFRNRTNILLIDHLDPRLYIRHQSIKGASESISTVHSKNIFCPFLDQRHTSWPFGSFYWCLCWISSLVSSHGILSTWVASGHTWRWRYSAGMELPELTYARSCQGKTMYLCKEGELEMSLKRAEMSWIWDENKLNLISAKNGMEIKWSW